MRRCQVANQLKNWNYFWKSHLFFPADTQKRQCTGAPAHCPFLIFSPSVQRSGSSFLHHHIHACRHTSRPGTVLVQPAELLTDMIGALAVQKRDRAIFYLQVDHIVAHIIQVIMIFVQREGLRCAAAKVNDCFQTRALLPRAARQPKYSAAATASTTRAKIRFFCHGFQRFLPEAASDFSVTLMQRTCWQQHLQCGQRR